MYLHIQVMNPQSFLIIDLKYPSFFAQWPTPTELGLQLRLYSTILHGLPEVKLFSSCILLIQYSSTLITLLKT